MSETKVRIVPKKKSLPTIIKKEPAANASLLNKINNTITAKKKVLPSPSITPLATIHENKVLKPFPKKRTLISKPDETESEQHNNDEASVESEVESDAVSEAESEQHEEAETETETETETEQHEEAEAGEDNDSEYEKVLTPQLQEILEFMADDEKVFMIKGSQLQAVGQIMQMTLEMKKDYQELLDSLTKSTHEIHDEISRIKKVHQQNINELRQLTNVKAEQPTAKTVIKKTNSVSAATLTGKKVPVMPNLTKTNKATKTKTNTVSVKSSSKASLLDLLEDFKDTNKQKREQEDDEDEVEDLTERQETDETEADEGEDISLFNKYFDTVYILNIANKGVQLGEKLHGMGVNNCQVIDSELPKRYNSQNKHIYYLRDALENAIDSDYEKVLILHDDLFIHKNFDIEFAEMHDTLDSEVSDWNILQFGYTKKINLHRPTTLDWEYYVESYPHLELGNEKEATKHWRRIGYREGRVGAREIFQAQLDSFFAFGISNKVFDKMLKKVEYLIKKKDSNENIIKLTGGVIYGIKPNLFIKNLHAAKKTKLEYGKYQWNLDNYDTSQ